MVRGLFDEETLEGLRRGGGERAERGGTHACGGFGRNGGPGRLSGTGLSIKQLAASFIGGCTGANRWPRRWRAYVGLAFPRRAVGLIRITSRLETFSAVHRDVLQCDIAVITSLTRCTMDCPAGELVVYPDLIREPLSTARAAGRSAGTSVPLDRGHTMILLGGIVPHEVAPASPGQERIVAINCYRALTAAGLDPGPFGLETPAVVVERA